MKFKFDERNSNVIRRVFAIMYIVNILSLIFIVNYRQFVLDQSTDEFMDIANILVCNIIVGLAAVLYLGGITFPKVKLLTAVLIYIGFVSFGFAFTMIKYGLFYNISLTFEFMVGKLLIILPICAILMAVFLLFGYLGQRKIEKEIS